MLDHHLVLQRIYIWQLYAIIWLYIHPIVLWLNYCMSLIQQHYFLWHTTLGEESFKILSGIKSPSAPESTLHIVMICLWLMLNSNLVTMTNLTLSMYLPLLHKKLLSCSSASTVHKSPSCPIAWTVFLQCQSCCCHHINLQTALKWFCFAHSLCLVICRSLLGWVPCAMVLTSVLFLFVYSGCAMVLLLCILPDNVKVFCFLYVIKGRFLHPFCFYPMHPQQYMHVHYIFNTSKVTTSFKNFVNYPIFNKPH